MKASSSGCWASSSWLGAASEKLLFVEVGRSGWAGISRSRNGARRTRVEGCEADWDGADVDEEAMMSLRDS